MLEVLGALLDRGESFVRADWSLLLLIAVVVWCARRGVGRRLLRHIVASIPRSPWVPAFVSLALSIAMFAIHGEPLPSIEDDHAQLLIANTLRHGRFANPAHPLWKHFETMAVIQRPVYASPYQPGTGMFLALIPRHPIVGIWLATALAVAAIVWAARAVLPPRWSTLCGLVVAIHPTTIQASQLYNSSAVPLLAGALFVGAMWRMKDHPSQWNGSVAALGAAGLALSRPFEGLVLVGVIALTVRPFRRAWTAGAVVLVAGALLLASYNRAITGNALDLPHALYDRQYNPWPNFMWESPRPVPVYNNQEMRFRYASWYAGQYRRYSFTSSADSKISAMLRFVAPDRFDGLRFLFAAPLLLIGRRRRTRDIPLALILFLGAPLSIIWIVQTHYVAPAGVLVAVAYVSLLRDAAAVKWSSVVIALLAIAGVECAAFMAADRPVSPVASQRHAVESSLVKSGGKHLIMVPVNVFDCVYNGADIDGQRVIWARELDNDSDRELMNYYGSRTVWRLSQRNGRLALSSYW